MKQLSFIFGALTIATAFSFGKSWELQQDVSTLLKSRPTEVQLIAKAHGIEELKKIEEISYTFHAKLLFFSIRHRWTWNLYTDQVQCRWRSFWIFPKSHTYHRNQMDVGSKSLNQKVDRWFVNDRYWLMAPYHLVWDSSAQVELKGTRALPIGEGSAKMITLTYPSAGGYTPGDAYDIYYDSQFHFKVWAYRKENAPTPRLVNTFENYQSVGPLSLALDHRGMKGHFRVWFSEVSVR